MSKIPTAEHWVNQQFERQRITTDGNDDVYCSRQGIIEACVIFAQIHVKAALEAAAKKNTYGMLIVPLFNEEQQESILNAYPENLIV